MRENQENVQLDIKELFLILLWNLKWIVLAMALGGAVAYTVATFLVTPLYKSTVSLYVNNTGETEKAAGAVMNINDINASQKLVNTYIVILQDDEVMEQVAARLLQEYDQQSLENIQSLKPEELRKTIRMSSVNNTEVLRIEAQSPNAQLSARMCAIMTELAPDILQRVVKAGSVEVIGQAKPSDSPSFPNVKFSLIIGAAIGMVLSAVTVLLRDVLDNTVKDEEDMKAHFNVPVLGEIPDFQTARKDGYREYGYK